LRAAWWLYWRITKDADDAQRRELGLRRAAAPAAKRMAERGSLEIQAYEQACFPKLAAEWHGRRPFVGALTLQLPTDADGEVTKWIDAGTPPIYFGFGSTPILSPADTIAMIAAACAELGERALIYRDVHDSTGIQHPDEVRLVGPLNYGTIFPLCRAAVHHGGAGTTAAALRAGIPMLILWDVADQPLWAATAVRLKVGCAQRFSTITRKSLVAHLHRIRAAHYVARAGEIATHLTDPAESVTVAADLIEGAVHRKRVA
jgi:UDP:flavonoid glycosyltransferase YjiC (YdhE family)